ncbi:hypothetical protein N9A86_02685 [Akkermansiaceae bacterium]|nr:hypothetical protein [Akkermansiaceae bacterium]
MKEKLSFRFPARSTERGSLSLPKSGKMTTSPRERPFPFPLVFKDCGVVVFLEEVTGKRKRGFENGREQPGAGNGN